MIDTLTLSRELTKVGIPSAHADAIAVSANCTRAETRGVLIADGSGDPVPRAPPPPPPSETVGQTPKHAFSPADRVCCCHRRRGRPSRSPAHRQLLERGQNCY